MAEQETHSGSLALESILTSNDSDSHVMRRMWIETGDCDSQDNPGYTEVTSIPPNLSALKQQRFIFILISCPLWEG